MIAQNNIQGKLDIKFWLVMEMTLLHFYGDCTIASLTISDVNLVYCEVDMPIGTPSL